MGISTIIQVSSQSSINLGNMMLPGKIFIGEINVKNKVPIKTITNVIVKYISKKLSAGDDIFPPLENKCKQVELRIVFKFSIINSK